MQGGNLLLHVGILLVHDGSLRLFVGSLQLSTGSLLLCLLQFAVAPACWDHSF